MAETKKKTTAKKANTTAKANTTKNNTTKKTTGAKKTTTKKTNTTKKTTTKKTTQLKEYDIKKTTTKKPVKKTNKPKVVEKVEEVKPIEEVTPVVHPMSEPVYEEVKVEETKTAEIIEVKPVNKVSKKDKLIDTGILVVIIGLFVLLVTAYLATTLSLTNTVTKILVGVSLVTELTGIILIIIGSIKKD